MFEVTEGAPKELLVVGGQSVLEHVVDEALAARCREIVVVSSPAKPEIERHVRTIGCERTRVAYQDRPLGIAHAVAAAGVRDEPVLVLLADAFYLPESPIPRLAEALSKRECWSCVALRQVVWGHVGRYGIAQYEPDTGEVHDLWEKPRPEKASSNWAIAGRVGLSREAVATLFALVEGFRPSVAEPELHLTRVLQEGLRLGRRVKGFSTSERQRYYDCGDPEGYWTAAQELGL